MFEIAKNIKIFFFDIDSTTFDHSISKVRDTTYYALRALKKNGYKICICTSRTKDEMRELPKDFVSLFDGFVCEAGAYMEKEGTPIVKLINKEEIKACFKYLDSVGITYRYATVDGGGYLNHHDTDKEGVFYHLYQMVPEIKPYEGEDVIHVLYYRKNEDNPKQVAKLMPSCQFVQMKFANEITTKGVDKSFQMLEMAEMFGFSKENVAAFGDGANDVSMIEAATFGVAMGNGVAALKQIADIVADDISNEGLYKVLVQYGFIDEYKEK